MVLQHSGSSLSPKLQLRAVILFVCHLAPSHSFALVQGSNSSRPDTDTLARAPCDRSDSYSDPSTERHSEADDDLTSLIGRVMTNAEARREKRTERNRTVAQEQVRKVNSTIDFLKLRKCQIEGRGGSKQETGNRRSPKTYSERKQIG